MGLTAKLRRRLPCAAVHNHLSHLCIILCQLRSLEIDVHVVHKRFFNKNAFWGIYRVRLGSVKVAGSTPGRGTAR